MEARKKNRALIALIGVVILSLIAMMLWNAPLAWRSLKATLKSGRPSLSAFEEQLQLRLTGSVALKYNFIDLNGWFAARLGQTECNKIIRLSNGMLTDTYGPLNLTPGADSMVEFKDYLAELGIEFLYVQAPFKVDPGKLLLPRGCEDFSNENVDALIARAAEGGVDVLDLRPTISATPELVERYYYRTDHHWNYDGAFAATQLILERLRAHFPDANFDFDRADLSQWDSHTLSNWFLGSHGERTGRFFGGVDDFTYYTPKFDTRISCLVSSDNQVYTGDFSDAIMRSEAHLSEPCYFNKSAYSLYLGGDYGLTLLRNPDAPNDLRILVIKDSYARPVCSFLSTMFREVALVDSRYFTDTSVAEYVRYRHPDLVVQLNYPKTIEINPEYFQYGTAEAAAKDLDAIRAVLAPQDVTISQDAGSYSSLPVRLERGQSYILRFDGIEFAGEASDGAAVGLYDPAADKSIHIATFDVEYSRENGDFAWYFTVPEDAGENLELRFCAGLPQNPAPGGVTYRGVRLDAAG